MGARNPLLVVPREVAAPSSRRLGLGDVECGDIVGNRGQVAFRGFAVVEQVFDLNGLGALLLTLISNGFNLLGWNTTYLQVVQGCLILFAVAVDRALRQQRE